MKKRWRGKSNNVGIRFVFDAEKKPNRDRNTLVIPSDSEGSPRSLAIARDDSPDGRGSVKQEANIF